MTDEHYAFVPLSTIIDTWGEDVAKTALERFIPWKDNRRSSLKLFLTKKSIPMEKQSLSRTYLAVSYDDESILGFVSLGLKCIKIPTDSNLSKTKRKLCNIEETTGVAQAYLIGQLARSADSPKGFGKELLDYGIYKLREAKKIVGCRIARIDCTDELVSYYSNHNFELIRKNKIINLNQMIIII